MTKEQCIFLALADMLKSATLATGETVKWQKKKEWIDGLSLVYDQVHDRLSQTRSEKP